MARHFVNLVPTDTEKARYFATHETIVNTTTRFTNQGES